MFPRYLTNGRRGLIGRATAWMVLILCLFTAQALHGATACQPASATLTFGADDYFYFYLNGITITAGASFDPAPASNTVSIPVGDFAAAGSPNYFAARIQNSSSSALGGTWMITITCADGSLSYITDGDASFQMYDDTTGTAPPPVDGSGNTWFDGGYSDPNNLFTGVAVPVTVPGFWLLGDALTNPVTGQPVPVLSHSSNASQAPGPDGFQEALYFRESIVLPVVTLTPTPTPFPTACGTPVFQAGGPVDSGCPSGGVTNVTINNPGGPGQILLVAVDSTNPLTTVSYANMPMTQLYSSGTSSLYYLLSPPSGSGTMRIVQGGSSFCSFYAGYGLFGYVDQSPPSLHGPFNTAASTWTDTFAPSNAGSIIVDYVVNQQGGITIVNGSPVTAGTNSNGYNFYMSYLKAPALPFSYSNNCCGHTVVSHMLELIPPQGCAGVTPSATPTQAPPSATPSVTPAAPTKTVTPTFTPPPPGSTRTDTPTVTPTPSQTDTPGPSATPAPPAGPGFGIVAVYPNPVPGSGCFFVMSVPSAMTVNFKVYDLRGELIWSGSQVYYGGGVYQKPWAATNNAGAAVSYGAYFLTANAGSASDSKWLTVVR